MWTHGELLEAIGTGKRISARFLVEIELRGEGARDISGRPAFLVCRLESDNKSDTHDHPAATQRSRGIVRYNASLVGARQDGLPKVELEYSPDSPECCNRHESGECAVASLSTCFQQRWTWGRRGCSDIGHNLGS
jgi:hypothetical protein